MNFERGKDPKETIGIGIEEYLIQKISEHINTYLTSNYILKVMEKDPIRPTNTIGEWVREGGTYIKLICIDVDLLRGETKYRNYYIEYDIGGLNYGACSIEEFLEKPK